MTDPTAVAGHDWPPAGPLTITTTSLGAAAAQWDALADRVGASPFLRPGWVAAWCEAFAAKPPEVIAARRDDRLVAALPLLRDGRRLRSPTNWETPEFGMVAADGDAAAAVMAATLDSRPWYVSLAYLDAAGSTAAWSASAARDLGYEAHRLPQLRSPVVDLTPGWDAYQRRLSKGRRSELRRRRRRLEERGTLALDVADGRQGLDRLLDEGFRVEASGWKGREGTAILSDPAVRRFYAAVSRWAADRGLLRLTFLRLDGRPIAFALALAQGSEHYLLKFGYEEAFRSAGPGILLVHELIRDAMAAGGRTYHFLGTDQPWKSEWSDGSADRVRHVIAPPSPAIRVLIRLATQYVPRLPGPVQAAVRRVWA